MEYNGSKDAVGFNTYGSPTYKQVYIYGALDIISYSFEPRLWYVVGRWWLSIDAIPRQDHS